MGDRLPYSPTWRLCGGEPGSSRAAVHVSVTMTWESEPPVFKAWSCSAAPSAWTLLEVSGDRDADADDLRITGWGSGLKKDGTVGQRRSQMRFGRLDDVPTELADRLLDAWTSVAIDAGRAR